MPSAKKVPLPGMPHEICFRVETGLPFPPTRSLLKILRSQLAAAAALYTGIKLIAWVYMANHVHMLVLVESPDQLGHFVEYIKRESAHAINNLLGRNQRTVWADGYYFSVINDAEKLKERLAYFYTNPTRAGLVESIDEYPGFTSWEKGYQPVITITERHVGRETIPALSSPAMTDQEDIRLAASLGKKSKKINTIEVDTLCWLKCYESTKNADREQVAQEIRDRVYGAERLIAKERKYPVIGGPELRRQSMLKPHAPKKFGPRMLCMGTDVEHRKMLIRWFKSLFAEREELRKKLSPQEFLKQVFPGFFRPGGYMDANLNPLFVPI